MLGRTSIKLTMDLYGRCLPVADDAAVDRLDDPASSEMGADVVAHGLGKGRAETSILDGVARLRPVCAASAAEELRRSGG
jgi:hypothetical protein